MKQKDRNNNFDVLRLFAAILVIEGHAFALTKSNLLEPVSYLVKSTYSGAIAVAIFFLISGYLITKSYLSSNNIIKYFLSRIFRIIPGLLVCCVLTIFVIIPISFSVLGKLPNDYFINISTYNYLKNILLYPVQYNIENIKFSTMSEGRTINGSLWTLSYEFTCYVMVAILGVMRLLRREIILMMFIISYVFFLVNYPTNQIVFKYQDTDHVIYFLSLFLCGSCFYLFRDTIVFRKSYFIFSIIILMFFAYYGKFFIHGVVTFGAYIVFFIAFQVKPKCNILVRNGDFSYGIYIYGFLIQQVAVLFFGENMSPFSNMLITYLCVIFLSILSWKFVENPCLLLLRKF